MNLGYFVRKLLAAVPLLWGVLTLTFLLIELAPGDASDAFVNPDMSPDVVAAVRLKWGLDLPAHERYFVELRNMASGDFGRSITMERPVSEVIAETLPNTLQLAAVSLFVSQLFGVCIGIAQSVRQYSKLDSALAISTLFFYSMPAFWLALMLQLVFCLYWNVLPSSGMVDAVMYDYMTPTQQIVDRMKHLVLPGVAMGLAGAAGDARFMRSAMLEVIRQDYIRTARAKGLPEWKVIGKHALRNALLPVVTLLGLNLPFLFSGSVLVEYIFGWPGMGRLIVNAIMTADSPVIMGCFFVFTLLVVVGNLLSDLLYAIVDPRIRLT